MKRTGVFVISLDFELFWGVRDKRTIENYGDAIRATHLVVPKLIDMFNEYSVKATFATVGFLFAENKEELKKYSPLIKPSYYHTNLSPYLDDFELVLEDGAQDPYHYAYHLISSLKEHPQHEIASHTFSHFYCQEKGQTAADFEADIKAAVLIAKDKGVKLTSLAFPRNQFNLDYLKICNDNGITNYRGNEEVWFYKPDSEENTTLFKRIARTLDCYINISGKHCYIIQELSKKTPYNIPSSRFLRPYAHKLKILEKLKVRRIKKAMTYAAKNGLMYHLWWHPHNFGNNIEENFNTLKSILEHFRFLNEKYNFESKTMAETGDILKKLNKH
tara:strand:- start:8745 stop:9737 length:993 start_codon:yes stop_codon:yes gene_type:complete